MKRPVLLLSILFAAAVYAAPWTLYKGSSIVKPRVGYASLDDCTAGANAQPAGTYRCEGSVAVTVAPMPMGPYINDALIPKPALGFSDARWMPIPAACADMNQATCDLNVWIAWGSDIGAFRVPCTPSHYLRDDPLLFPGQPGKSHPHAFYGNTGTNANSTQASLSTTGNSTCNGGTLVRSAIWIPAVIDEKGAPVPFDLQYYQKGSYEFDITATVSAIPSGLRMVTGDAKNTDPNNAASRFVCVNGNQNPGWKTTIKQAIADGTCVPGATFFMSSNFPFCWDGKNLDSPDHKSHMSGIEQYDAGGGSFPKRCPASHPVAIPTISLQFTHVIGASENPAKWRLASDMDPKQDAGTSGHADYWANLDPTLEATITQKCIREKRDGHDNLTCDGKVLF